MTAEALRQILRTGMPPFYATWDFWIFLVLGIAGTLFSILAFKEAGRAKNAAAAAKEAAGAAGRSVKIQTVTIELTEILQRLDKLDDEISFPGARDLLSEVSRRLRRLIGPFSASPEITEYYGQLKEALKQAKNALESVRPSIAEVLGHWNRVAGEAGCQGCKRFRQFVGPNATESGLQRNNRLKETACSKMSKAIKERSARNSESEVNSNRSVSLGRQGRLDYVNFGTYVPRI